MLSSPWSGVGRAIRPNFASLRRISLRWRDFLHFAADVQLDRAVFLPDLTISGSIRPNFASSNRTSLRRAEFQRDHAACPLAQPIFAAMNSRLSHAALSRTDDLAGSAVYPFVRSFARPAGAPAPSSAAHSFSLVFEAGGPGTSESSLRPRMAGLSSQTKAPAARWKRYWRNAGSSVRLAARLNASCASWF